MDVQVTLAEAARILHPQITEHQLRAIIRALRWQSSNPRRGRGNHATYPWTRISELHQALLPFIEKSGYALRGGVCPEQDR